MIGDTYGGLVHHRIQVLGGFGGVKIVSMSGVRTPYQNRTKIVNVGSRLKKLKRYNMHNVDMILRASCQSMIKDF